MVVAAVAGYELAELGASRQEWTFTGGAQAPTAVAHLVYLKDRQQTVLTVTGCANSPAARSTSCGSFRDGAPVPKGISTARGGKLGALIAGDITRYDTFAITVEPGEDRSQPRSPS